MEATANHWYVPKTEVGYVLWNRLTGVQNPERLDYEFFFTANSTQTWNIVKLF